MTSASDSASSQAAALAGMYGDEHRLCSTVNPKLALVLSCEREIDLFELEQLCDAVGWSRRPVRRVRKALDHSLLWVGLWRHEPRLPRLVGFYEAQGWELEPLQRRCAFWYST